MVQFPLMFMINGSMPVLISEISEIILQGHKTKKKIRKTHWIVNSICFIIAFIPNNFIFIIFILSSDHDLRKRKMLKFISSQCAPGASIISGKLEIQRNILSGKNLFKNITL